MLNGFVCKIYGNTYAVHVTVALVGVATLNLALPAPLLLRQRSMSSAYLAVLISILKQTIGYVRDAPLDGGGLVGGMTIFFLFSSPPPANIFPLPL